MKKILIIIFITLFLNSCAYLVEKTVVKDLDNQVINETVKYTGFWDQAVIITAYGFTMATPYGPFNLGYVQWQWNIEKPVNPSNPSDAFKGIPGSLLHATTP